MLSKKLTHCFFLALLVCGSTAFSQNPYQDGWKAFDKNNRDEARRLFNQAATVDNTKMDALLSLSLLDWMTGKPEAAFDNFCRAYELSTARDSYFYAYSDLPYFRSTSGVISNSKIQFFEKILSDSKVNGTIRAMVNERMGEYYDNINNSKKAKQYFDAMGALSNWQILGTFDNTSGSGYAKDWGVLNKAQENDIFKNKVSADIHWYYPGINRPNNWFYFDYFFPMSNAVMYAQSFVNSNTDQDVYLRSGTSGSLKIWVNDGLISAVSDERNCDLDIYSNKIKLNKGVNRILVQIGISDIERANFLIRLTNEHGEPVNGIASSPVYGAYTKAADATENAPLPFFAEEYFEQRIKADSHNPINYLMLANTYLHNDKAYEATKILKQLEGISGKTSLISNFLNEAYIRSKNQTDNEKELEAIKTNDPDGIFSLETKFNEAIRSEKYTDATDIWNKYKLLYGDSPLTDDWELRLASLQKRYDDVINIGKKLYVKYPENASYARLNYLIDKNVTNNPKSSVRILEDYCKKYDNNNLTDMLSKAYIEMGSADKGLEVLYKRIERYPYISDYYGDLLNTLFNMQRYGEALTLSEKQVKLTPFLASTYSNRGYICKNAGKTDEAGKNFEKAIYYGPTSYDSRSQLRQLNNKKDLYELFPKSDLQELIKKAPSQKEYPEDNSVILLNDYQMVVYPENAKEYRYELAIKILNQSGIESWKQYSIGYNSYNQKLIVDKSEVIKANGSISKAETNNDNEVVFTNLEVNDVLHLEYRIQDFSTGKLAGDFFDHFCFRYTIPSVLSRYSLLVPNTKKFNYKVANGNIQPTVSDIENMKLYVWEMEKQDAVKDEPYKSDLKDFVPTLYYSSMPDWKYVSDWYKDLTTSKFNTDFVLNETIAKLLKGHENASPIEKARIFYNYILENITYSSVDFLQGNYIPQKASRTITTRLGDCKDLSTLFVALCRQAGIDANLVLIDTRDNGNHTIVLPEIEFNHCIAQLNVNNKTYYLELTDNNLPFGGLPSIDRNAQILPIPYSNEQFGDKLISLNGSQNQINQSVREHKIALNKNDMSIERKYSNYGAVASNYRNTYKNLGSDEQLKKMSETVAKEFEVSSKVTNLKMTGLDQLSDSVVIGYHLELKNMVQDVAGMKIFRLPWSDTNSLDIVASEDRKYPMEYWSYQSEDKTIEKMTIEIPAGKKLAEIPKNIKLDCSTATYQLTFNLATAGKMIVTRYFERKKDQVNIVEYPSFRDFLNKVSEADNKQFALK